MKLYMDNIALNDIQKGMTGITPIEGANLLENFVAIMHTCKHVSPTKMTMQGMIDDSCCIEWEDTYTQQMANTYADTQDATERAGVCISVLLTKALTGYTVIQRSWKGTGCDYFLGDDSSEWFDIKARLEVSAIYKENSSNNIRQRFVQKCKQVEKTDDMGIPAYISVIAFDSPKAYFDIKKNYE